MEAVFIVAVILLVVLIAGWFSLQVPGLPEQVKCPNCNAENGRLSGACSECGQTLRYQPPPKTTFLGMQQESTALKILGAVIWSILLLFLVLIESTGSIPAIIGVYLLTITVLSLLIFYEKQLDASWKGKVIETIVFAGWILIFTHTLSPRNPIVSYEQVNDIWDRSAPFAGVIIIRWISFIVDRRKRRKHERYLLEQKAS